MHEHNHIHKDDKLIDYSKEEIKAHLNYMLKHNQAHLYELEALASGYSNSKFLRKAIESYKQGNDFLSSALKEVDD